MQPADSSTFEQVYEQCLYIVIGMVCCHYFTVLMVFPYQFKPFIPKYPGGLLYPFFPFQRFLFRIEFYAVKLYLVCFTPVMYKLLIKVCSFTS